MTTPEKHPQELEVWHIIPAIRKELVKALKERKFTQKKIAELLNVTEAAVSQYLKEKRAKEVIFSEEVKKFIHQAAEQITDQKTGYRQLQKILQYIRGTKTICRIHMGMEAGLEGCDICYKE